MRTARQDQNLDLQQAAVERHVAVVLDAERVQRAADAADEGAVVLPRRRDRMPLPHQ